MNTIICESSKCTHCGEPIPYGIKRVHCLRCLLQLGMGVEQGNPAGIDGGINPAVGSSLLKAGDWVEHYRLLEQIGEGSCGVVFMAEQQWPISRTVALKVIRLGMDTWQGIARFEAERQALALLDHPNIPKVFDAGVTESGRHFFVMELVRGIKITDYCDREKLSIRRRLQLFVQVCQAMQHAHQKGLIHRDLKPSNILVTEEEPGGAVAPKIIDFGIVKSTDQALTNKPLFTAFQQFMGTPAYMSPEQAGVGNQAMDTRSDIFSLGAVLYELLSGLAPLDAQELEHRCLEDVLRLIRDKEPLRPSLKLKGLGPEELRRIAEQRQTNPSRLINVLRGDLDWIVTKCQEKNRNRRYETAFGLAADLEQYLHCRPVVARPPGNYYRFQKLVGRHQLVFAASAAAIVVLTSTLTFSVGQAMRQRKFELEQANLRKRSLEMQADMEAQSAKNEQMAHFLEEALVGVVPSKIKSRDTTLMRELLDRAADRLDHELANQPEVQLELRNTLAEAYRKLGLYQAMEKVARKAVVMNEATPGKENDAAATALAELGESLAHLGQLNAAENLDRRAMNIRIKLFGPNSAEVGASLNNLAMLLRQKAEWSKAENLFRQVLLLDQRLPGEKNIKVAADLANLGATLWNQGKSTEAEAAYRKSLDLQRESLGDENPEIALSLNNLGTVLTGEGRLSEAEQLTREALSIDRKILGNQAQEVAVTLGNLGKILAAEGELVAAEAVDREALEIDRNFLGNENSEVVIRLTNLSQDIAGQGRLDEARLIHVETGAFRKITEDERPNRLFGANGDEQK